MMNCEMKDGVEDLAVWLESFTDKTHPAQDAANMLRALRQRAEAAEALVEDYEHAAADKRRLAREMAVMIDGEDAAKQPALCDVAAMVRDTVRELTEARAQAAAAWEAGRDASARRAKDEATRRSEVAAVEVDEEIRRRQMVGAMQCRFLAKHIAALRPPTDASAALQAVKDAEWNAAIEAAANEAAYACGCQDNVHALRRNTKGSTDDRT